MMGKPEIASILADYLEARIAGGPT
jgi:hypothetical protein